MNRLSMALTGWAVLSLAGTGWAQAPSPINPEYLLTAESGPWLICAASYVGPKAPELAQELTEEIRTRFHLPAYILNRGDDERRKQREYLERVRQQIPAEYRDDKIRLRVTRVEEQCAVLIGGYRDQDAAIRALKDVKKLPPPSQEHLMPTLTQVRAEGKGENTRGVMEAAHINPFVNAFVTHNPHVPQEQKAGSKNDPFLKKLNAYESLSLLKCKKPYTLAIASFQGVTMYQSQSESSSFLDKFWNNGGQVLELSGQNAHNLAQALRQMGLEAYVLHLRSGSLVTVGSFDRPDDPGMAQVQRALASNLKLENVPLLPQPLAIEVPRP